MKGLVYKGTMLTREWGSEIRKFDASNAGEITTVTTESQSVNTPIRQ